MFPKGRSAEMDVWAVFWPCHYKTLSALPPAVAGIRCPRVARLVTRVRISRARKNTEVGGEVNLEGSVGHIFQGSSLSSRLAFSPLEKGSDYHVLVFLSLPVFVVLLYPPVYLFAHTRTERSVRKPYQLLLPCAKSFRYVNSFFFRSSGLLNALPHNIQAAPSIEQFQKTFKTSGKLINLTPKRIF